MYMLNTGISELVWIELNSFVRGLINIEMPSTKILCGILSMPSQFLGFINLTASRISSSVIKLTLMFQIPTHPPGRWSKSLAGNAIADLKPLSGPSN